MKLINLIILNCLIIFSACEKEDDDDSDPVAKDPKNYISCIGGNTCVDYTQTNFSSTQVADICDQAGSTASEDDCPTTYSGSASTGVCTAVSSGITMLYRFYYGTVSSPEPATEETVCTTLGNEDGTETTWQADSLALSKSATYYCRYENTCARLDQTTEETAQSICHQVNGYLDLNCEN